MAKNNNSGSDRINICCGKIAVRNFDGLCSEEYCGRISTQYFRIEVNGLNLFVPVCDEHAEKIEGMGETNE